MGAPIRQPSPPVRQDFQDNMDRQAAATYLAKVHNVSYKPHTLAKLASVGGGPPFSHFGRYPRYKKADLDRWVAAKFSS